jgi:hypothetical protein
MKWEIAALVFLFGQALALPQPQPSSEDETACTFADAEECLRDTAVLILGSSVSRGWHFQLQGLLTRRNGKHSPFDNFVDVPQAANEWSQDYRERKNEHSVRAVFERIMRTLHFKFKGVINSGSQTTCETYNRTMLSDLKRNLSSILMTLHWNSTLIQSFPA